MLVFSSLIFGILFFCFGGRRRGGSLFWRKEKGNGGGKRKVYILFVKGGDLGFGEPVWLLT